MGEDFVELFDDLEKEFAKAETARKRQGFLAGVGLVVGLFLIFFGIGTTVLISIVGYVLMLLSTLTLVNRIKDKATVEFTSATKTLFGDRKQQSRKAAE